MSVNTSYSFQFYKTFLDRAVQQEKASKFADARKLYLYAAQSLLQVAGATSGEVRDGQIKEIEHLYTRAESLRGGGKAPGLQKAAAGMKGEDITDFAPEAVPNVKFEDIAGLEDVKREVRERVIQPMNDPELYRRYRIKPGGGVLMFGLPGTGKTMIARAIAHEVKAPFFHIHCSDIKVKWVGATEQNIAALFNRARQEESSVLFFDEFDGLGGKADENSGNMRGMLSELKSQMDGFDKDGAATLLLLAATNHPWDIDSPFLRSGRFSKMIYIPLPDPVSRGFLLRQQLRDVPAEEQLDYDALVQMTDGFSGADVVLFCDDVKMRAVSRSAEAGKDSLVTLYDATDARERFRSTVMYDDIRLMKEFMQKNGFRMPERM